VKTGFSTAHISALEIHAQTKFHASVLPATPNCANHKARWDWSLVSDSLSTANLAFLLCRWYAAFRSFRAHIRIQSARNGASVDVGPALQRQGECYQPNERTTARAEGIEKLRATHPWADAVDLQMFLAGFDAGEKYCICSQVSPDQNNLTTLQSPILEEKQSSVTLSSNAQFMPMKPPSNTLEFASTCPRSGFPFR